MHREPVAVGEHESPRSRQFCAVMQNRIARLPADLAQLVHITAQLFALCSHELSLSRRHLRPLVCVVPRAQYRLLVELNLAYNLLRRLSPDMFPFSPSLVSLKLGGNPLLRLSKETLF